MANLSYCQFQNMAGDLRDCADNMGDDDLSVEEWCARRRLIKLCVQIANDYGDELETPFPRKPE